MDANSLGAEIQRHDFQDVDLTTVIFPLLTQEHKKLCGSGPYPFTEATSTWTEAVNVPNTPLVGAPSNIRAVRFMGMPQVADFNGNLSYLDRVLIARRYGRNSYLLVDFPRHYNMWGGKLYVWPYFSVATMFALDYHMIGSTIAAGLTEAQITLPPDYHDALIDRVVARLSRAEGDLADGTTYDQVAERTEKFLQDAYDINMDQPNPMLDSSDWDDEFF